MNVQEWIHFVELIASINGKCPSFKCADIVLVFIIDGVVNRVVYFTHLHMFIIDGVVNHVVYAPTHAHNRWCCGSCGVCTYTCS